MRLDKYVASCTGKGRTEVKNLIRAAKVTVNGEICKKADAQTGDSDDVRLNSQRLVLVRQIFIMMNKPKGVVCACKDERDTTVIDLVKDKFPAKDLFPAGRLDKDSTGFVLITNDGQFAHSFLAPKKHVSKTYDVVLDAPVTPEMVAAFEAGVTLASGEKMKAAQLKVCETSCESNDESGEKFYARVVITQGVYHQVKRMFGVFGVGVLELHRSAIGELELDKSLRLGEFRTLEPNEIDKIVAKK